MIDVFQDKVLLQEILTAITDAIMVINRDWITVYMNAPALEITNPIGYSPIGREFWTCFPDAVYPGSPYLAAYYKAMDEGVPGDIEAYYPPPLDLWFHVQVRPTAMGIILFTRNTTLQKRMTASLVSNEKLAALGRLSAVIAHEINNPLETAQNALYLALGSEDTAEANSYVEMARTELDRITAITRQTLRVNKKSNKPTRVGSDDLLRGLILIYEDKASRHRVRIQPDLGESIHFVCYEGEIRQVLNNLVGNAIDAMPDGGKLAIRVRKATLWHTGRPGIRITVSDNGVGMSADTLTRLFSAFFTTKGIDGTGLGLWISKQIVEKHGGLLLLRSSQRAAQRGTTFSLLLPIDGDLGDHSDTGPEAE
ncbi:His Kinase A (phospho-acceptor) domain-containing protein [Granulicella rosea]|uniref:histidine kinase n=1 Tax=Granulicella rosea TaxID=474952 RepID=A0A239H8S6_9BACT|nr:PAS domain-containing sensor histidine kinase [Granulicella rosea]SNS77545.1 His Kinase A (phospho-acceptor) domain-containing protein [Granulicella rosea]